MKFCEKCGKETAAEANEVGKLARAFIVGGALMASCGGDALWLCEPCTDEWKAEKKRSGDPTYADIEQFKYPEGTQCSIAADGKIYRIYG